MSRRTRSILFDNTLGKLFTNTKTVTTDPSKLIAGTKLLTSSLILKKNTIIYVAKNIGNGAGIKFTTDGLITKVILSVTNAPVGRDLVVKLKMGTTYETSVEIATVKLNDGVRTSSTDVNLSIPSGNNIYYDITQVGSIRQGSGLTIITNYFRA